MNHDYKLRNMPWNLKNDLVMRDEMMVDEMMVDEMRW